MNYFTLIEYIKRTSLQFAKEFYEGDVYEFLNSGNHKYPSIILTTQNVSTTDNINSISGTLFCVDRLTDDSSNRLEIQSNAFNKLQRIISALEENTINLQSNTYTPFTEKFADLCGGMFVEFSFQYVGENLCVDDLEIKEIELTQNGIYDVIGYDRAIVNVRPVVNLEDITITDNGEYTCGEGFDGFGKVNVDLRGKVNVGTFTVSNDCINSEGRWEGEVFIDTSECTSFNSMFLRNSKIKKIDISNWNTDRVTDLSSMFGWSGSISEIIGIEKLTKTKPTTIYQMFIGNRPITVIDFTDWDMSNLKNGGLNNLADRWMLQSCVGGRTVDEVIENDIKVFNGLKITVNTLFNAGTIDRASLRAIINGLADLTGQTTQTLTLGATNRGKLTEEDISIAVGKNWSIA